MKYRPRRNARNIPPLIGGENVTLRLLRAVTERCYAIANHIWALRNKRNTGQPMLRLDVTQTMLRPLCQIP